jgi:hypothetical protein
MVLLKTWCQALRIIHKLHYLDAGHLCLTCMHVTWLGRAALCRLTVLPARRVVRGAWPPGPPRGLRPRLACQMVNCPRRTFLATKNMVPGTAFSVLFESKEGFIVE